MRSLIKHPKDYYAGLMYVLIGIGAIVIASDYNMGSSVRMGPGYFPTILGTLLVVSGAISMIRAFFHTGEAIRAFAWKEIFLVLGSVVLFGLLVRGLGLVPALALQVVVSAWASDKFRLRTALLLGILSSIVSALIFVKGLGMPYALIGPWLGM